MPYAEPTSPVLSPKDRKDRYMMPRRHSHGGGAPDVRTSPPMMPALPRRTASSAASTPRKGTLSNSPRHQHSAATAVSTLEAMRAVQTLPRRTPPPPAAQPLAGDGLGLKLNTPRLARDSQSSDSSIAPSTPEDRTAALPAFSKPTPPRVPILHTGQRFPSASSSPTEPTSPQAWSQQTRMIRKKSGEILKSSLKQRSMSTPNLGRGGSDDEDAAEAKANTRSTRDLGEHAKSVRFNDMGLESVVLFLRKQRPTAVSKTADTNEIPTETDEDNDTDLSDYVHFRTRRNPSRAVEEQTEIQIASSSSVPRIRVDFGPGTQGVLKGENVVLERFELSNSAPLTLRGTVITRNVAFQKWVAVRFTLDHWQTTSEVAGQHVSHVPSGTTGDEGWDRFSFAIKLEDYRSKLDVRTLQLCVRYSIDGHEWWDSNNGDNYQFTFKSEKVRKPKSYASAFHAASGSHGAPVLRQTRQSLEAAKNPRNWVFPRTGASTLPRTVPPRSASPMLSPPPAGAYRPPSAPDVHTHLNLRKWCAPSPPQSPTATLSPLGSISLKPMVLPLAPERERAQPMTMVHGRPATTWPPAVKADVFSSSKDIGSEKDGETTPMARSPDAETLTNELPYESPSSLSSESEEDAKIPPRRSSVATDLHALGGTTTLMTPPSSNLSSPETPTGILPPESPLSTSTTSDSSPAKSLSWSRDEGEVVDDTDDAVESRGRTLNAASYQDFLDKFCFFKSPPSVTTPLDESFHHGMSFAPKYASPSPYYTYGMGSQTPPGAITPTFESHAHGRRSTTPTPSNPAPRASSRDERSYIPSPAEPSPPSLAA